MEGLGGELRRWRAARGLSLVEAARRAGVDRRTLWIWESGATAPRPRALVRLLDVLAVAPEERTRALAEAAPRGARDELAHTTLGSPVHLGGALRALRLRARLTQAQAAARLGVNQATIARWESGAREPEGEALGRALALLGAGAQDATWARSLVGRDPIRFSSPLDAKAWLDENQPSPEEARDVRLLAFEREVWLQAAGDPRWERLLVEAKSWRALAHGYAGDVALWDEAARGALALASRLGAWEEAGAAVSHDVKDRLSRGVISLREADRRYAETVGRLPDGQARWFLLHDWVCTMIPSHPERAEALLGRMRESATQGSRPRAQDVSAADVWQVAASLRWRRGDPEGTLEALERATSMQGEVFYETLRTKALHRVEPGRPTEAIVQKAYSAAQTATGRDGWRGVARELGLPSPR